MKKLGFLLNIAPHYRKGIFSLFENNGNCKWIFGSNDTDIPSLPSSFFKNSKILKTKRGAFNTLKIHNAANTLLHDSEISEIITLGDIKFLPSWQLLLLNKLTPIKARRKKIHLWSHGWTGTHSPLLQKGIKGTLLHLIYKLYFSLADSIFLYSNYSKQIGIAEGINDKKITVVHNSLDYDHHLKILSSLSQTNIYSNLFPNNNPNLIFIGRITPQKQLHILLQAISLLHNQNFPINLTIIGAGPQLKELKSLASTLKINQYISWQGECYDDTISASYIFNADICVSPGNVGLTAIHSLTFGTPVITNNNFLTQMPEFEAINVSKNTGSFFEAGNAEALAEEIKKWIINHPNRDNVREACKALIKQEWTPTYQFEKFKEQIDAL